MRIRELALAATAAVLLPLGIESLAPAAALTSQAQPRYVVLAGYGNHLVYAEKTATRPLDPGSLNSQAHIYALGRTGKPVLLGRALPSADVISLSQSNLVIVNPFRSHNRVRSWNLATGHHGDVGTNEDVVGATPDGWIAKDPGFSDGTHVVARSDSGNLTDYGDPVTPGVDFAVTVGPRGFVAYADSFPSDNGEITYTPWSNPSVHRTLLAPGSRNVRCGSVSASYAACTIGVGTNQTIALFALRGGGRTNAFGRCANDLAVWGTQLAWNVGSTQTRCATDHVGVLTQAGRTQLSRQRFDPLGLAAAWGRLVTSPVGQASLVTLNGVRATPRTLGRAKVG